MRRQDIQLLALARKGDIASRCEAGKRYLSGSDGFPRHLKTGIEYLTHPSVAGLSEAKNAIAEFLRLDDLVAHQQLGTLKSAAGAGNCAAQVKLAAWVCARNGDLESATDLLEAASAAGYMPARFALEALKQATENNRLAALLKVLDDAGELTGALIAIIAAHTALAEGNLSQLARNLVAALTLAPTMTVELAELIAAGVRLSEVSTMPLTGISSANIEDALEICAGRGDRAAAYALGRALCGLSVGAMGPNKLAGGPNVRKGVGMLARAADAGCEDAWLHLYRMHSDRNSSVSNPQMARFYLEKAALAGRTEAQRRLGALMLRSSDTLSQSERAIEWLHRAACAKDPHARRLLKSLVLPLEGGDSEAQWAIAQAERDDPWLAVRMQLSRHFGLTKLEALCVDPSEGMRPWGLVVGVNPFTSRIRLSAPRAIPAMSDTAMEAVKRAASFFGHAGGDVSGFEGDLRRRSVRQNRVFERYGLDESMFFAAATGVALDALRLGPKWAFKARDALQMALAA